MSNNKTLFKFLAFIGIGVVFILWLLKHAPERFPFFEANSQNIASIVSTAVILFVILYNSLNSHGAYFVLSRITIWFCVFLVIITFYAFRFELIIAKDRVLAVMMPSYNWSNKEGDIVIARSQDGHFYTEGIVNGKRLKFMIDTGASDVALTKKDAGKLGIDVNKLQFTKTYNTANGTSKAAPLRLETLAIGDKIFTNIEAHVTSGELDISLLGMSVLSRFYSFKINNDLLTLSYKK